MKTKNNNLITMVVVIMILAALTMFVAYTNNALTSEVLDNNQEISFLFDIDSIMTYYIASINDEESLLNKHYYQDTSPDEETNCISCHDKEKLRELFILIDVKANEVENNKMKENANILCLTCHGSYEELAILTSDLETFMDETGSEGSALEGERIVANPHIYAGGLDINEVHYILSCTDCHSVHQILDPVSTGLMKCYSCHHEKTFKCGICHTIPEEFTK